VTAQSRELQNLFKEVTDKVRGLEKQDQNEVFGIQVATALSRIEKLELSASDIPRKAEADVSSGRVPQIEAEIRTLRGSVAETKKVLEDLIHGESRKTETSLGDVRKYVGDIGRGLEERTIQTEEKLKNLIGKLEKCQSVAESAVEKVNKFREEEEAARADRRDKNMSSSEDLKRDIRKIQDQTQSLDDKIHTIEKTAESNKIQIKNSEKTILTEISVVSEKVKGLSTSQREDKLRLEDKLTSLEKEVNNANRNDTETKVNEIKTTLRTVQSTVEDNNKRLKADVERIQTDLKSTKSSSEKNSRGVEDLTTKIFDCLHETETLKDQIDKVNKKVDRRPATEEIDKKSELTNKLYNDLASKIDEVDDSFKKEIKKNKTDLEKTNNQIKELRSTVEEKNSCLTRDITSLKDDVSNNRSSQEEGKKARQELSTNLTKMEKELKNIGTKVEEALKEAKASKTESSSLRLTVDKLKSLESDLSALKKENSMDKLTSLEKDISSLRSDLEKNNKSVTSVSTEVKYLDSNLKKEVAATKTEISNISKNVKSAEKDLGTLHNMVEVLNQQQGSNNVSAEVSSLKNTLEKTNNDVKAFDKKVVDLDQRQSTLQKSVEENKDSLNKKIKEDTQLKEELTKKIDSNTTNLNSLQTKVDASSKNTNLPDTKEIDKRIKQAKDELNTAIEASVKKCKDEINTKITLADTKNQKTKEDLTSANKDTNTKIQGLEKKLEGVEKDAKKISGLETKVTKQEAEVSKFLKQLETVETTAKQAAKGDSSANLKKEMDTINKQIQESLNKWDGKMTAQETQVSQVKQAVKDVAEKLAKVEKPAAPAKTDDNKKEVDALSKTVKDNQKKVEDKLTAQEKGIKEMTEKIGKLEKADTGKSGLSGDASKLTALTKAIDTIQENSKSLETMVKKMKTEVPTQKDLEKMKSEILSKAGGGKGLDPNHPDIGPLMDSLIMTNDRPYVDCTTLTPMTGNGLIKFERFTAMNKLPWDDANDQFIIQEPGVYAVHISGILQDAVLSVKIASNMLEREVCAVGSRDGVIGVQAPAFVFRSGIFQIEDDDNVCETVFIEIHADNDDSFVDKNVSLTLFKIAESNGSE